MEFHQKQDAEQGVQAHHVAPGDTTIETVETGTLRKRLGNGYIQGSVRSALGSLDALLTKCYGNGDLRSFRDGLRKEDVLATHAALELIRRQTVVVGRALTQAEKEHGDWLRAEVRRMLAQEKGTAE
jgi:hypothetical protein